MSTKQNSYGYIVWLVVTMFVIYSFCLNTAAGVFVHPIQETLKLTAEQTSGAVSCFVIGFAVMQIPVGFLLDKFNNKVTVCCAILCLAFGCFLTSISRDIFELSMANIIMGIGGAFAFTAAGKTCANYFSMAAFPIMFGLTQTLACVFSGAIHYLLTNVLIVIHWNIVYQMLAGAGLLLFILNFIFFKDKSTVISDKNLPNSANKVTFFAALRKIVTNKQIWSCTLIASFSFGVLLAYAGFWYIGKDQFYNVNPLDTALEGILIFVGIGIGTPFWALVANYYKSKKGTMHFSLSIGAMFLLLGIYLPHFNIETQMISHAIGFCIGFFISGSMLTYALAAEAAPPELTGLAISFVNTFVFVMNTIFLSLPYKFFVKGAVFTNAYWLFPFSIIISVILLYHVKEEIPIKPSTHAQAN